jgi:hypothetical protein
MTTGLISLLKGLDDKPQIDFVNETVETVIALEHLVIMFCTYAEESSLSAMVQAYALGYLVSNSGRKVQTKAEGVVPDPLQLCVIAAPDRSRWNHTVQRNIAMFFTRVYTKYFSSKSSANCIYRVIAMPVDRVSG